MSLSYTDIQVISEWVDTLIENGLMSILGYKDGNTVSCGRDEWAKRNGLYVSSGCTKACIEIPFEEDYVIKVPTWCRYGDDYCLREYHNYLEAKKSKLERFFPETYRAEASNGFCFLIQERVDAGINFAEEIGDCLDLSWYDIDENSSEDEINDAISSEIENMDDMEILENLFSWDWSQMLVEFCEEWCINDLHQGNFGRRIDDGQLVIIDFSGY